MAYENLISIGAIIINLVAIGMNIHISNKTIKANQDLNKENVGKNRVIYETEQMDVSLDRRAAMELLNSKLSTGNYTILTAFVNKSNTSETRYVIGKIKA